MTHISPAWQPPPWDRRVMRYLQVEGHQQARELAMDLWQEALQLIEIKAWYRVVPCGDFERFFNLHSSPSQAVTRLLAGATLVALIAVSLGPVLENRARAAMAGGEVFRGYMLDRMGSLLAESRMSHLAHAVKQALAGQRLRTTRRYSPGYKDFGLEAQRVFVQLAGNYLSLDLGPGNQLLPEKSITAIMGASPTG